MSHVYIDLPDAPSIDGLQFRQFAGDSDYPEMARVMNVISEHEGVTALWNAHTAALFDSWIHDFDPPRDRLMAEIGGQLIGVAKVQSERQLDGKRIYSLSCNVIPQWRGKGIEPAILRHNESRLRQIATRQPLDGERVFHSWGVAGNNTQLEAALREMQYQPIRYAYQMVRPNLENIPHAPLPSGVQVRPVREEDLRKIWDANREAFRDHWGFVEPPEGAFETWVKNTDWNRELTRVAWAGDEVVGMVLIFVPQSHNERASKKRAETESICVRRPWRKQGIARALIAQCLHAIRDAGFDEAALGVDTQNPNGALKLYEQMGYRPVQRYTRFEKKME